GNDEVRVSVPHASATLLADNIERLTFVGSSAFKGYGNASNNIITGDSGNDTLYGGAGADQFIGGDGYDTVGYLDSKVAMTIDLKTGMHSGIASGDTYTSIEAIGGSNFNDIFYAASSPMGLEGASGTDLVTYVKSNSAVTIDLNTGANAGDAAGDTYTAIEIFQGSNFNDTLSGSRLVDIFVGGAGADSIDGREGLDSAWYITSTAGVTVNLQTQVNTGGDAAGDVLTNIERVVGSHFNDTLTGDAATNYLEGGLGNDVIRGGDGNDYLYGGLTSQIGPFTLAGVNNGPQADVIYGGNGNDTIVTAADDRGSKVYGEAGGDVITVASGTADGGEGNDLLTGTGLDFSLLGGAGDDRLVLKGSGLANGGQGNDMYTADTAKLMTIQDDGTSNGDTLILSYISYSELMITKADNDLYFHRSGFAAGETPQDGVRLKDWFNGYNTIEELQTADGQLVMLTGINSEIAYLFG
uniref:calcium-binding protein n=1 Tax=Pseudomonas ovata TaxID=1839709 RepID=UPI00137A9221